MLRLILVLVFFFSISLFTTTIVAQTGDGETPAEENVCDGLLVEGITPGLYGLCVAYCEAEAHGNGNGIERILVNYNRRRQDNEPEMPCLEPEAACPCWDDTLLADAPDSSTLGVCGTDVFLSVDYTDPFVVFLAQGSSPGPTVCFYQGPLPPFISGLATTPTEDGICRDGIQALILEDFGGTCP